MGYLWWYWAQRLEMLIDQELAMLEGAAAQEAHDAFTEVRTESRKHNEIVIAAGLIDDVPEPVVDLDDERRLRTAERLLLEAGFVEDVNGNWIHPDHLHHADEPDGNEMED